MLFTSLVFLFYFLPGLLIVYYCSKRKLRNYVLLIFSLLFYAWGGVSYSLVLLGSLIFNFVFVKAILANTSKAKLWLSIGILFNVLVLFIFKYLNFFIDNLNGLVQLFGANATSIPEVKILLPLGISFYTFQQMSMLWDTYRNPKPEKISFLETSLYTSFFPQLIAGPIVRYNDIISQIKARKETLALFNSGVERFIVGLFKKIIIANTMAQLADSILESPSENFGMFTAWLGILSYGLQIYFDFSGYSDMAIGLGRMFGFQILENFNYPYISMSIKEFWRRWHISLSSWFKDYVYIPIGGNQKGIRRTYLNLLFVFFLTGFWHGATWSFVFWGLFHGFFILLERVGLDRLLDKIPMLFRWSYTMVVVLVGWVFFRIEDFSDATNYVVKMFTWDSAESNYSIYYALNKENSLVLLIGFLLSSSMLDKIREIFASIHSKLIQNTMEIAKQLFLIAILVYCIVFINSESYNPFIYFRF